MDFFAVVLVLLIYFIRPQDWVPGLIGVGIVNPVMMLAMVTMVVRARNLGRPLKFLATPQDWAMLAYYAFIVWTSPDPSGALKGAFPLFAFYFVTVQALDSPARLRAYMKYWMIALVVIAAFGVGSLFGWDFTGAAAMTAANKGRLAIGTWMHNNPNALGHSVILVIPMAYFLLFWRSSMTNRLIAALLALLAFECVMRTESKGAFLAGFIVIVLTYAFGRSKIFQILLVTAAVAGSGAVLSIMPRMKGYRAACWRGRSPAPPAASTSFQARGGRPSKPPFAGRRCRFPKPPTAPMYRSARNWAGVEYFSTSC
jgi:hypothetical protein